MAKAPDPQHGDKITGLRGRIAQCAEGGESRAQQRRRVDGRKILRNGHQAARPGDQHFGISAVAMNAGEFLIATVYEVASATIFAMAAGASEEADAHTLPDGPALYMGAERVDPTDGFMAGHPRPVDWKRTLHGTRIRMAYAASLDAYPHLAWPRIANGLPHELKPSRGHGLYRLIARRAAHHSTPSTVSRLSARDLGSIGQERMRVGRETLFRVTNEWKSRRNSGLSPYAPSGPSAAASQSPQRRELWVRRAGRTEKGGAQAVVALRSQRVGFQVLPAARGQRHDKKTCAPRRAHPTPKPTPHVWC